MYSQIYSRFENNLSGGRQQCLHTDPDDQQTGERPGKAQQDAHAKGEWVKTFLELSRWISRNDTYSNSQDVVEL